MDHSNNYWWDGLGCIELCVSEIREGMNQNKLKLNDDKTELVFRLQMTQPTSCGAVTVDSSCCANCVEPCRPIYRFWACRPCGLAGWLVLLLTKVGDVETNPCPTTLNKQVWVRNICHKQIHVRKQISIRCNRIEHWVHLRCAGICQAQYTAPWTCYLHR